MAACAVMSGMGAQAPWPRDTTVRLVVRNSFLEFLDDLPAESGRPRAMTDITGSSTYDALSAEICAGIRHLGDGLRSEAPAHPGQAAPAHQWLARMTAEVAARAPFPSEPQYASMASSGGANALPYATQRWGYPAPALGLSPMANPGWGDKPYPGQGQQLPQLAKPQVKAKAKAKKQAKASAISAAATGPVATAAVAALKTIQAPQLANMSDTATTVMLRNIPNGYTQCMLLELLKSHGFAGRYDFVYLPMDFRNAVNLGYAFVNLADHACALELMRHFHGCAAWHYESTTACEVSWAHPNQGLSDHVERYRNSPVMHPSMPDEYKPMVFQDGQRLPFPLPTKTIRAPKLRPVRDRAGGDGAREGRGED